MTSPSAPTKSSTTRGLADAASNPSLALPVLPLRNTVLFPEVTAPIGAGRPGTLAAVQAASDDAGQIFVVGQRDESIEEPVGDDLFRVGTIAQIREIQRIQGGLRLVIQGARRARVHAFRQRNDHLIAELSTLPIPDEAVDKALVRELKGRASQLNKQKGVPEEIVEHILTQADQPGDLADLVGFYLDVSVDDKQELLETLSPSARLKSALVHVERQITMHAAREEIRGKVQEELGQQQRAHYLRQQLKAIQEELDDMGGGGGGDDLRDRLDALPLPPDARKEVDRELDRLDRIPQQSPQYGMVRGYLETMADLPWAESGHTAFDLQQATHILERDHHGLDDVKDRVIDFLAVRKLKADRGDRRPPEGRSRPDDRGGSVLLFAGPPGVGKTSIARSIADALNREYVRVALGGVHDESDIRGHRRTYMGAMPGRIIRGLQQVGTRNPVFLLDELDKLGSSFQGDPAAALMEVLDPEQNSGFVDHYLGVPFDLSDVLFIGTANVLGDIPGPLRDRLEIVEFRGYTTGEKLSIAREHLLQRQLFEAGLDSDELFVTEDVVRETITTYTHEAGVRQLERRLGTLCRKAARALAEGATPPLRISGDLRPLLGKPLRRSEDRQHGDTVGVATGMYYTPAGGDIMLIEASAFPGNDNFVLTGQLGDVMQESARAALTYVRGHAGAFGLSGRVLEDIEVHLHVPAGAVPKEGPSAGLAMTAALVSVLTDTPVRSDLAMTGEITLTGRILPVGGIKEKVLGAYRSGIREVLLPEDNADDIDDLPDAVRDVCTFTTVSRLDEALPRALPHLAD